MNKEKMIKWAEALESGQYKQCRDSWGRGRTSHNDKSGFCCLHVALDLEGKTSFDIDPWPFIEDTYGITGKDINNFIFMNDDLTLSFLEIAVEIRKMVAES